LLIIFNLFLKELREDPVNLRSLEPYVVFLVGQRWLKPKLARTFSNC
jgi:hypothetical protein